jgi:leukotriene-A4 hydrolase
MRKIIMLAVLVITFACNKETTTTSTDTLTDPHSFSKPSEAVVKHLDLDITVDFESHTLSGKAKWKIDNISKGNEIVLDINTLEVERVTLGDDEKAAEFHLGEEVEYHGKPLHISIEPTTTSVTVYYKTTKDAVALQWLTPEQTADKKHPFLFSQGQSIWSRTWIPCQDSPGVRFTYNAKVSVPKDLMAVMSAINPVKRNEHGVYEFKQEKPIPSYLMAIAVGDITFRDIDDRTGVYAEHSVIEAAEKEFSDLGRMVYAAEKLYGPYRWGRYDVLVLPPSFPYGGMENPNLTFLTPGIIAGDKSMTNLLAHELGHSWSGNLVTNATWDDIWLNEGFTTYVEHRIGEAIFGKSEAAMHDVLSRELLKNTVAELGADHETTALYVKTVGNPDDGLTDIPYEKGYAFLQALEAEIGRDRMDKFVRDYFEAFAFKSITTDEFIKYFEKVMIKGDQQLAERIRYKEWIFKPGTPENVTRPVSAEFDQVDEVQKSWRTTGVAGLSSKIRSTNERIRFIDNLPADITEAEMDRIDNEFKFTEQGNFIVKRQWFVQAIRHEYKAAYPAIEKFMIGTSRTGSLQSLYKEMVKTPEGKKRAKAIFEKAKPGYHLTTVQSVSGIVG